MKRIIALGSFLFIFLMTVLPASLSHAAENNTVKLSSISFVLENGKTINAVNTGDNKFYLDLVGDSDYASQAIQKIVLTSDNADTLSVLPPNFDYSQLAASHLTKDDYDIHFVNKQAVLDSTKLSAWAQRVDKEMGSTNTAGEDTSNLTIDDLKTQLIPMAAEMDQAILDPESDNEPDSPFVLTGFLADQSGNNSPVTLTVKTKGWKTVGNKWTFFDEYGDFQTGWFKDAGKWYFFDDNGVMKTGWVKSSGKWYYLNAKGAMTTGWVKVANKWYYMDSSGAMKSGWVKVSNKWFYFDASGSMKTGWIKVQNKYYFLYNDGHMAVNAKIDSYKVGKDGARIK
ncbi:N-acetylmuramoyl-L-alanine amidase family protein [Bacillus sp. BRMEA1]|uniref:N-acetylmuramoyl-L-alanine amidase family protein n=1 Tax=Neobacillus endophyticus TaxID=2738405 RepID=UPI0015632052|nr:N-acetylmuramoyl-L-alanine amidase family protein [Neobacillus endophyticus]NRD77264.1 N-acetylmuramoyl-L-alanine amidase family protein [Neobacillus endophyticus]